MSGCQGPLVQDWPINVRVGNTAINMLSGRAAPDSRLLNGRYGERFTPRDVQNMHPLPSGLLGPVMLKTEN